jgi:hypothetical protein
LIQNHAPEPMNHHEISASRVRENFIFGNRTEQISDELEPKMTGKRLWSILKFLLLRLILELLIAKHLRLNRIRFFGPILSATLSTNFISLLQKPCLV